MHKNFLIIAASFGLFAVVLGAFGAHGLKESLSPYEMGIFETGIRYHFYHAFAIFACSLLLKSASEKKWTVWAARCFSIGILLFSGSLYLLATRTLLGIQSLSGILGPLTPIGGLFFVIGWGCLVKVGWDYEENKK